ncbi:MAG: metalloprotease, partial [Marinirhabdus sp.]
GGFKSKLRPAFANNWITTVNASTNIWKWIFAYGDAGLVNSKGRGTKAVFGTGIRLNLVADYFELYFPLYSNLGWEPALPGYDQKIRFIVTLSPRTLLGLFTREWY